MDDFVVSNLRDSKDEWCCYLVDLLTPLIRQGIQSMFQQAWTMCVDKNETEKYLMTFQNLLTLINKWNSLTIEEERKRIVQQSGCSYLEELIVCVHIIHLKVMTHIRVGNRQKKIDISLPKLDDFIHKVYIHCARQIYKNVYLFERNIEPLTQQKYNRELELIIQQSILTTVRESIPKEQIIRSFLDENMEVEEEVVIEPTPANLAVPVAIEEPLTNVPSNDVIPLIVPSIQDVSTDKVVTQIKFNDFTDVLNPDGQKDKELMTKPDYSDVSARLEAEPIKIAESPIKIADSPIKIVESNTISINDLGITDLSPAQEATQTTPNSDSNDLSSLLNIQTLYP